ncbi:MAG: hypothetical protein NXH72_04085 [Hyphomonadaceae bacterium]|nr:hypothetical protein [Hyphomonadaceae bacterium]
MYKIAMDVGQWLWNSSFVSGGLCVRADLFFKIFVLAVLVLCFTTISALGQSDIQHAAETEPAIGETVAVSEDRLDAAFAAIEGDDRLQKVRPEWEPEFAPAEQPRRSGTNPIAQALASFFNAIGSVLGYLLALIILLAILAGVYMVFGESLTLRGRQKDKAIGPDTSLVTDLRPEQGRARALLEDADALAAQGRFAEAVHLLLFKSIDDIQEQKSGVIGRSLTAREIGALGVLPETVRDALSPIIRVVERSFFGGQTVNERGWKEARASYETFAFGEAWG